MTPGPSGAWLAAWKRANTRIHWLWRAAMRAGGRGGRSADAGATRPPKGACTPGRVWGDCLIGTYWDNQKGMRGAAGKSQTWDVGRGRCWGQSWGGGSLASTSSPTRCRQQSQGTLTDRPRRFTLGLSLLLKAKSRARGPPQKILWNARVYTRPNVRGRLWGGLPVPKGAGVSSIACGVSPSIHYLFSIRVFPWYPEVPKCTFHYGWGSLPRRQASLPQRHGGGQVTPSGPSALLRDPIISNIASKRRQRQLSAAGAVGPCTRRGRSGAAAAALHVLRPALYSVLQGLAVLGLPLAYTLSVMLPWVWQGSLEWAALLCGLHTRAHGASRWQGCHLAGAAVPAASRAVVLAGMLLGASSACPLLTELHRA